MEFTSFRHPTSPQRPSAFTEETHKSLYATVHAMPLRIDVNSVNSTTTTINFLIQFKFTYLLTHVLTYVCTYLPTYSVIHLHTYLHTCKLTYLLTYILINGLSHLIVIKVIKIVTCKQTYFYNLAFTYIMYIQCRTLIDDQNNIMLFPNNKKSSVNHYSPAPIGIVGHCQHNYRCQLSQSKHWLRSKMLPVACSVTCLSFLN